MTPQLPSYHPSGDPATSCWASVTVTGGGIVPNELPQAAQEMSIIHLYVNHEQLLANYLRYLPFVIALFCFACGLCTKKAVLCLVRVGNCVLSCLYALHPSGAAWGPIYRLWTAIKQASLRPDGAHMPLYEDEEDELMGDGQPLYFKGRSSDYISRAMSHGDLYQNRFARSATVGGLPVGWGHPQFEPPHGGGGRYRAETVATGHGGRRACTPDPHHHRQTERSMSAEHLGAMGSLGVPPECRSHSRTLGEPRGEESWGSEAELLYQQQLDAQQQQREAHARMEASAPSRLPPRSVQFGQDPSFQRLAASEKSRDSSSGSCEKQGAAAEERSRLGVSPLVSPVGTPQLATKPSRLDRILDATVHGLDHSTDGPWADAAVAVEGGRPGRPPWSGAAPSPQSGRPGPARRRRRPAAAHAPRRRSTRRSIRPEESGGGDDERRVHSHSSLSELARRRAASAAAAAVGLPAPAVGSQSVDQTDARMGPPYVGGGCQSGEALEAVASYSRLETLEEQMSIINAREDARDRQLSQITVLLERTLRLRLLAEPRRTRRRRPALGAALAAAPPPATPPQRPRLAPRRVRARRRRAAAACLRRRRRATARAARSGRLASESSGLIDFLRCASALD